MPSLSVSSSAIRPSPHVGFSRAISRTSSRMSVGNRGRPRFRDLHVQNVRNSVRCHLTKISGLTMTKRIAPSEESRKSRSRWFRPTFLEQSKLFSEEEVLSDKGCPRTEEKSDNRQQLWILQRCVSGFDSRTRRTDFLRAQSECCSTLTSIFTVKTFIWVNT